MKLSDILQETKARPVAYILIGMPKSGKSTWATNKIKKNFGLVNLNIDKYEDIELRSDIFEHCLDSKKDFIYEGIALKDYRIEKLLARIKDNNYRTVLVYFKESLKEDLEIKNINKLKKKIDYIYSTFKDKFDNIIEV